MATGYVLITIAAVLSACAATYFVHVVFTIALRNYRLEYEEQIYTMRRLSLMDMMHAGYDAQQMQEVGFTVQQVLAEYRRLLLEEAA